MVGADIAEKRQFMTQAAKDWESILLSRAKELALGGRFVCMNFGIDEKGRYLGNTGGHSMFDRFNQHWKTHLDQGIITKEEILLIIDSCNIPVVVDAGLAVPSDAAEAMEMGASAVLVNTAVAQAENPTEMGEAFKLGVEAGRKGYLAGRIPSKPQATTSSPGAGINTN